MYAVLHDYDLRGGAGLAKSTDGGKSWELVDSQPLGVVAVDPVDAARLVKIAGTAILLSYDGGMSWQPYVKLSQVTQEPELPRDVAIEPAGSAIWLISSTGTLLRIESPDSDAESVTPDNWSGGAARVVTGLPGCGCIWVLGSDGSLWSVVHSEQGVK